MKPLGIQSSFFNNAPIIELKRPVRISFSKPV